MEFELNSVWNLTKKIQREEYRLSTLRDALNRITVPIDRQPRRNDFSSRIENLIFLIAEAEENLRDLYDDKLVARLNLLSVIRHAAGLSPPQERVLQLRYCDCLPYAKIAEGMSYALSHIYRLHREAKVKLLAQFDEIVAAFTTS